MSFPAGYGLLGFGTPDPYPTPVPIPTPHPAPPSPMAYVGGVFYNDGTQPGSPTFEGLHAQGGPDYGGDRAWVTAFATDGPPTWSLLMNDDRMPPLVVVLHPDQPPDEVPAVLVADGRTTYSNEVWEMSADDSGVLVEFYVRGDWGTYDPNYICIAKYDSAGNPVWGLAWDQYWVNGDPYAFVADGVVCVLFASEGLSYVFDAETGAQLWTTRPLTGTTEVAGFGHVETSYGRGATSPYGYHEYDAHYGYRVNASFNPLFGPWQYDGFSIGVLPGWSWQNGPVGTGFEQREWISIGAHLGGINARSKIEYTNDATVQVFDFADVLAAVGDAPQWAPVLGAYNPIDAASPVATVYSGQWVDVPNGRGYAISPGPDVVHPGVDDSRQWTGYDPGRDPWYITTEEWCFDRRFFAGCAKGVGSMLYAASYPVSVRYGEDAVSTVAGVHQLGPGGIGASGVAMDPWTSSSNVILRCLTHPDRTKFYVVRSGPFNHWSLDEFDGSSMARIRTLFTVTAYSIKGPAIDESTGNIAVMLGDYHTYRGYDSGGTQLWEADSGVLMDSNQVSAKNGRVYITGYKRHPEISNAYLPNLVVLDGATGEVVVAIREWATDATWGTEVYGMATGGGG